MSFGDQAGHDKAYMEARNAYRKDNPQHEPSPKEDVHAAETMLRKQANPKLVQNSISKHSVHVKDWEKERRSGYAHTAVAVAKNRIKKDTPIDERENLKKGQETYSAKSYDSSKIIAMQKHDQNRSR